jgi:hypothetical protein
MYLLHPQWCYATSAFHGIDPLTITTYHWPTTQSQHVHTANTPLDTYIKHSYLPEWVNFFLDCLTMNMKALRCSEMMETLTPTTQHNFSVIYFCAGRAQPVQWLGCRLDNRDLNSRGSQKFSPSPGAHPASYVTGTTALSLGINWPVPETDHSPPSNAKVMNEWRNASTPLVCLHSTHKEITFFSYLFSDAISNSSRITSYNYWTGKVVEGSTHGLYWVTSQYWHGPPVLCSDLILKPIEYKKGDYQCECCI